MARMFKKRYLCQFEDQIIALNLSTDNYEVYSEPGSKKMLSRITNAVSAKRKGSTDVKSNVLIMADQDNVYLLSPLKQDGPLTGSSVNCWELTRQDKLLIASVPCFIRCLITLFRIHRCARRKKLGGLIQLIVRDTPLAKAPFLALDDVVATLNVACLYFYKTTKCLEWACSLIKVAYAYGYHLDLVIGVQNRPFSAHAWVEQRGRVIGDDPDRRKQFAVIYDSRVQTHRGSL